MSVLENLGGAAVIFDHEQATDLRVIEMCIRTEIGEVYLKLPLFQRQPSKRWGLS